jgi:hypothetical protein
MKNIEAGKALDYLISEEIMFSINDQIKWSVKNIPYSTDMAAAWTVLEKIRTTLDPLGREWRQTVSRSGSKWRCEFELSDDNAGDDTTYYWAEAETAPLAICLAALKAVLYADDQAV